MNYKIVIWGLGKLFKQFKNELSIDDIVCLVDNNLEQKENIIDKAVISPDKLWTYKFDFIVIFASEQYYREISYQLVFEMGIDCKKILKWEYYLGKKFYNTKLISEILYTYCNFGDIRNILDIGGMLSFKQIWKLNRNINIDLLANNEEDFFVEIYRKRYTDIQSIEMEYDLILIKEEFLIKKWIDIFIPYANVILFLLPLNLINQKEIFLNQKISLVNFGGYLFGFIRNNQKVLKIYEVTHKKFIHINEKYYIPIHAGRCNSTDIGYYGDDTGENISYLNKKINECTALYWIWKNGDYDLVGLNHYRRFFQSPINNFMIQEFEAEALLEKYDIVVVEQIYTPRATVEVILKESICQEAFADVIKHLYKIVDESLPKEKKAFQYVFEGYAIYPCNMFLTSKKILNEYCNWLFPILFRLIKEVEIKENWDEYSKRIIGFIAERLLTVWIVQHKYKVKELKLIVVGDGKPFAK